MHRFVPTVLVPVAASVLAGCACCGLRPATDQAATVSAAHEAHEAYVTAINANDLDAVLDMLTDDVVFMAPNTPRLVGKETIRPWAAGYLDAFTIHWDKTVLELVVNGDWAFEQYAYQATDTPKDGGPVGHDTGKGIIIYRREADGRWRVARDAWNSDLPAAPN